jgi:serine/threonine protein kinase
MRNFDFFGINSSDQLVRIRWVFTKEERPLLLGTGRTAKVYLAQILPMQIDDGAMSNDSQQFMAVKCLRNDPDIHYAREIRRRFNDERRHAAKLGTSAQDQFVELLALGLIGMVDPATQPRKEPPEEKTRVIALEQNDDIVPLLESGELIMLQRRIREQNVRIDFEIAQKFCQSEILQGSFYGMQLCYGTLFDVLERDVDWLTLESYLGNSVARSSVERQRKKHLRDAVNSFVESFIDPKKVRPHLSGYKILNAFKTGKEAERVRLSAIVDLANKIAELLKGLHDGGAHNGTPLAHRDLKPGNILLYHRAMGANVELRLSDLGYVANLADLEQLGMLSVRPEYWRSLHVPGSLFYRAPEQSTLPIEVRLMPLSSNSPNGEIVKTDNFEVLSTKIDNVEEGDLLASLDVAGTKRNTLLRITKVSSPQDRNNRQVDTISVHEKVECIAGAEVNGHFVKATGFHTDGFSFGCLLYDLASGGKNPEYFYLYCLHRYQVDRGLKTVEIVLKDLEKRRRDWLRQTKRLLGKIGISAQISSDTGTYLSYLEDKRGIPIHNEVMLIICKCMLRNFEDSYYKLETTNEAIRVGYFEDKSRSAFEAILADLREVDEKYCAQSSRNYPPELRDDILIKLRRWGLMPNQEESAEHSSKPLDVPKRTTSTDEPQPSDSALAK